jgi:hypothetical protein
MALSKLHNLRWPKLAVVDKNHSTAAQNGPFKLKLIYDVHFQHMQIKSNLRRPTFGHHRLVKPYLSHMRAPAPAHSDLDHAPSRPPATAPAHRYPCRRPRPHHRSWVGRRFHTGRPHRRLHTGRRRRSATIAALLHIS